MALKCGIAIGSFGIPGVVELGIALARETCGDVPILICDDRTPPSRGADRLRHLERKYAGVELVVNETNIGHSPGDVRCFRNALRWARHRGLDYVAKFSQRFIPLRNNWLHHYAEDLRAAGRAFASQRAIHRNLRFPLRTEAVLFDVARCAGSAGFMQSLDPADTKVHGAAEDHVWNNLLANGLGPMHRWRLFGPDRFLWLHDVLWHNTDGDQFARKPDTRYREHAARLGIDLGPEFTSHGWHLIAAAHPEINYHML